MSVRDPAVAGAFYPGHASACLEELSACIPDSLPAGLDTVRLVGGVVPHAGWVYSGAIAGGVFAALARRQVDPTFVLFGAAHRMLRCSSALYATGTWRTPLGEVAVDEELARDLSRSCTDLVVDEEPHLLEHSLEVQMPFIQRLLPAAKVVPILLLPTTKAADLGRHIGDLVATTCRNVVFVGSSDLTHYGPRYGFQPAGRGEQGVAWSRDVNDRRMIDCLTQMRADDIVREAAAHHNACGAGALAATVAACQACGATRGILIDHRTSADVGAGRGLFGQGCPQDAVGYAGIVFA